MPIPGKPGNSFKCFPLVKNLPQCSIMDFKLFANGIITLLRSNLGSPLSLHRIIFEGSPVFMQDFFGRGLLQNLPTTQK